MGVFFLNLARKRLINACQKKTKKNISPYVPSHQSPPTPPLLSTMKEIAISCRSIRNQSINFPFHQELLLHLQHFHSPPSSPLAAADYYQKA